MSKPPDFSRHPQVEPEVAVKKPKILFKIVEDKFDQAWREDNCVISEDKPMWIDLYMKVGLYCGWSWKQFKETPYPVIKYINKEIDRKLKAATGSGGSFLNWNQLAFSIAIYRAFGGGKED